MARTPRYMENLIRLIRRVVKDGPITSEQWNRLHQEARGRTGGQARAEKQKQDSGQIAAQDDAASDSYEELIEEVQDAVQATFGANAWTVATYPSSVVYYLGCQTMPDADDDPNSAISPADDAWEEAVEGTPDGDNDADDVDTFFRVQYSRDSAGEITFGEQQQVSKELTFTPAGEGDEDEDPYESEIDEAEDLLGGAYGSRVRILATYPDHVVYCLSGANGDTTYFDQDYSEDEATEKLTLGDRREVEIDVSWEPVAAESVELAYTKAGASGSAKGGTRKLPANVEKLPANLQKMWVDVFNSTLKKTGQEAMAFRAANGVIKKAKGGKVAAEGDYAQGGIIRTPISVIGENGCELPSRMTMQGLIAKYPMAGVERGPEIVSLPPNARIISLAAAPKSTDKPWNGAASRFTDTNAYCDSCLIDENEAGADKKQGLCKLPVKEPDGTINTNAIRNAASRLPQVTGVSAEAKAAAEKKLASLKKSLGIGDGDTKAEDGRFTMVSALRLSADAQQLPAWQQLHKIGTWAMPHPGTGRKIYLDRAMGDSFIRNFERNVVRRVIPLDYKHLTDNGYESLGPLKDVRWGKVGQGLPGAPEPEGAGDVLYGRFDYNDLGVHKLTNQHFNHISPQYDLNYCDSESGTCYGPTIVAVATTNNPFLRLRDVHGNEPPPPVPADDAIAAEDARELVILEDGLVPWKTTEEWAMSDTEKLEFQNRIQALEAERAGERQALEAMKVELAAEKQRRHVEGIKTYLDAEVHRGLPPSVRKLVEPLLVATLPEDAALIALEEGATEPTHNLHNALKALVAEMPRVDLSVRTVQVDTRPADTVKLEDQVYGDAIKGMFAERGIVPRSAATNGSNGTHA